MPEKESRDPHSEGTKHQIEDSNEHGGFNWGPRQGCYESAQNLDKKIIKVDERISNMKEDLIKKNMEESFR